MSTELSIPSQEELTRIADAGYAIYNEKLKSILEPKYNGQIVAIHLDSGDYEVARNSPSAWKALELRHPEGLMAILDIGPPKFDPMMSRLYGSHFAAGLKNDHRQFSRRPSADSIDSPWATRRPGR
jgi:hypothetical protein